MWQLVRTQGCDPETVQRARMPPVSSSSWEECELPTWSARRQSVRCSKSANTNTSAAASCPSRAAAASAVPAAPSTARQQVWLLPCSSPLSARSRSTSAFTTRKPAADSCAAAEGAPHTSGLTATTVAPGGAKLASCCHTASGYGCLPGSGLQAGGSGPIVPACSPKLQASSHTAHAYPVQTVGGSWACAGKRHPGRNARAEKLRGDEMLWQPAAARSARSAAAATAPGRRRSMAHCACSSFYSIRGAAATAGSSGECRNSTLGSGNQQRCGGNPTIRSYMRVSWHNRRPKTSCRQARHAEHRQCGALVVRLVAAFAVH